MTLTLPRVCHAGLRGPDVLAYSDFYRRAGLRSRPRTRFFGTHMLAETIAYQHKHGLRGDGVVGPKTFDVMRPHFSRYEQWLLGRAESKYQPSPRDLIVGAALAAYQTRPYPYEMVRPYPSTLSLLEAIGSDCSGSIEVFYKTAHLHDNAIPDPSGLGFGGAGNTTTMLQHGRQVTAPRKASLIFYYSDYHHVGIYLGAGRVFSHGHPGDPSIISLSYATQMRDYL